MTAALDRALHGPDGPDGLTATAAATGILTASRRPAHRPGFEGFTCFQNFGGIKLESLQS